ncbi:MAG: hypothetical protein GF364_02725, partial [Candidatus Lokiarchaeota archaeon]|nr:hypothetical protein [Candidatus Lokiarchaeota archaeon]
MSSIKSKTPEIGIIFDLDGTLLDDIKLFIDLPFKLAELYGIELTEERLNELEERLLDGLSQSGGKSLMVKLILQICKEFGIPWYKRLGFLRKIY